MREVREVRAVRRKRAMLRWGGGSSVVQKGGELPPARLVLLLTCISACDFLAKMVLFPSLSASALVLLSLTQLTSGEAPDAEYDFVVIGSGPGGGPLAAKLSRAGHTVLILEAGSDQSSNINSEIPSLFPLAYTDPSMTWDFFVRNYHDEERVLRNNHLTWRKSDGSYYVGNTPPEGAELLGLYYPRGGTLGGSSAINAMGPVLPSDSDWELIADLTGDASWR